MTVCCQCARDITREPQTYCYAHQLGPTMEAGPYCDTCIRIIDRNWRHVNNLDWGDSYEHLHPHHPDD